MFVSVFSTELGSTADTCTASVYGALKKLTYFLGDVFMLVSIFSAEIHALRLKGRRIQRYAWFNSAY